MLLLLVRGYFWARRWNKVLLAAGLLAVLAIAADRPFLTAMGDMKRRTPGRCPF